LARPALHRGQRLAPRPCADRGVNQEQAEQSRQYSNRQPQCESCANQSCRHPGDSNPTRCADIDIAVPIVRHGAHSGGRQNGNQRRALGGSLNQPEPQDQRRNYEDAAADSGETAQGADDETARRDQEVVPETESARIRARESRAPKEHIVELLQSNYGKQNRDQDLKHALGDLTRSVSARKRAHCAAENQEEGHRQVDLRLWTAEVVDGCSDEGYGKDCSEGGAARAALVGARPHDLQRHQEEAATDAQKTAREAGDPTDCSVDSGI
jgi:hypothetical protein